ncbi:DUF3145 domain-containing protein [uncultured Microbacterium sp.]|uniref:DUF3145 domain-containing protein n=1 Tax=uncultured Microbacterium sp. TaxID=191216 RepID=UPI0025F2AD0F|nr:DUF3145 domain-containing protein [uncultured Microbacterium sp.]
MATTPARVLTRGVIFIHSAPKALCPHLEWAVGRALGVATSLDWHDQPVLPGARRAELYWEGPVGTGAALASAIRGWEHLRYEITEDPSPRSDGSRFMHTPDLGIHFAQTDASGSVVIGEDRIRYALETAGNDVFELRRELDVVLGAAWDEELEPFRHAGDAATVVWLHKVG